MASRQPNKKAKLNKWELSPYERQRTGQDVITDNTEIASPLEKLRFETMCPICLDVLKDTMAIKDCLHRFCSECIITYLRNGRKECPTCRRQVVPEVSLLRDPNFDSLISTFHPHKHQNGN